MFSIVLIGHGEISKGFLSAAEMIVGEQEGVHAVVLNPEDTFESYLESLRSKTSDQEDVLYLADLHGGTPANVASYLVKERNATCLAGINLPILLEILIARLAGDSIEEAVNRGYNIVEESVSLIK